MGWKLLGDEGGKRLRARGRDRNQEERGPETQKEGNTDPEKRGQGPGARKNPPPQGYCSPLAGACGEWGCLELRTQSPMSLPLASPRLVLRALADLVQGPGHLRNPHHGPCPPGLCGGPEGVPLPAGPGECPTPSPSLDHSLPSDRALGVPAVVH